MFHSRSIFLRALTSSENVVLQPEKRLDLLRWPSGRRDWFAGYQFRSSGFERGGFHFYDSSGRIHHNWDRGMEYESFGQRYTHQITKFPTFQDSDKKILIPISFDLHGFLPPNTFDHMALLYVDVGRNLAQLFCVVQEPIYRYAVKSYVMPRIRKHFPNLKFRWNRLGPKKSTKTFAYPDSCALLALWTLKKVVTLPAEHLDSLRFPSLTQMHAFRMSLGLDQDKENNPPVEKHRRKWAASPHSFHEPSALLRATKFCNSRYCQVINYTNGSFSC